MPFVLTDMLLKKWELDEFDAFIIYGPLGYGKTSYGCQALAETYGILNDVVIGYDKEGEPQYSDWEAVKSRMKFHPAEFIKYLLELKERDVAMIWDDAGLWLYALDWHHPFVKAVGRYLNVARTDLGGILFTTPTPTVIIKKIRDLPQARTIKIIKTSSDDPIYRWKPRRAKIYQHWITPDMKKSGVKWTNSDDFNAFMPNDFYEWYIPIRAHYAKIAKAMMLKAMDKLIEDTLGEKGYDYIKEGERIFFQSADLAIELGEKIGMKSKDFEG